ncbi:hypothetical protein GQ44DRAFT_704789 [Phaeosphaeriaceae sp. PMI808]|nr:hypothetical protein GQ44DRAFT_704789 [Phaeosphaeriaceae sp. PMI808]
MRRLSTDEIDSVLCPSPRLLVQQDWPFQTARTNVSQGAFVPGSRVNSTASGHRHHITPVSLSHILTCPWVDRQRVLRQQTTKPQNHTAFPLKQVKKTNVPPSVQQVAKLVDKLLLKVLHCAQPSLLWHCSSNCLPGL